MEQEVVDGLGGARTFKELSGMREEIQSQKTNGRMRRTIAGSYHSHGSSNEAADHLKKTLDV